MKRIVKIGNLVVLALRQADLPAPEYGGGEDEEEANERGKIAYGRC